MTPYYVLKQYFRMEIILQGWNKLVSMLLYLELDMWRSSSLVYSALFGDNDGIISRDRLTNIDSSWQ